MALRGAASCTVGFVVLALAPQFVTSNRDVAIALLHLAALFMAITSATVIPSLTAYTSLQCDRGFDMDTGEPLQQHKQLALGKVMGQFRSSGQAGRAIGPLIGKCCLPLDKSSSDSSGLACTSYWTFGPSSTYAISAIAMSVVTACMKLYLVQERPLADKEE